MKCPFCKKKDVSGKHPALCGKNPKRVRSPGRPPTQKAAAQVPIATVSTGTEGGGASVVADIQIEEMDKVVEDMPDLEREPDPTPPPEVETDFKAVSRVVVDTFCDLVESSIQSNIPGGLPAEAPPLPRPVSTDERLILTDAATPVIQKYLPQISDKPEVILLIAVVGIFGPRMVAARKVTQWVEDQKRYQPPPPVQAPAAPVVVPRVSPNGEEALLALGDKWVNAVQGAQ